MNLIRINYRYRLLVSGSRYFILDTKPSNILEYFIFFLLWLNPRKLLEISELEYKEIRKANPSVPGLGISMLSASIVGVFLARANKGHQLFVLNLSMIEKIIFILMSLLMCLFLTYLFHTVSKRKLKNQCRILESSIMYGCIRPVKSCTVSKKQLLGYSILCLTGIFCFILFVYTGLGVLLFVWLCLLLAITIFGNEMAFTSDRTYELEIKKKK